MHWVVSGGWQPGEPFCQWADWVVKESLMSGTGVRIATLAPDCWSALQGGLLLPVTDAPESRQAGFEALALPLADQLYGAALRLTRQPQAAEDLVQETLLRAWRFFDRFEPGTNFRAWVFRILTNLFINHYRKAAAEPEPADLDALEAHYQQTIRLTFTALDQSPDQAAVQRLEAEQVRTAIDALPDPFRLPVILCDLEGFSYREIAAMLDIPIGTVMSRLFRGRKQLYIALLAYAQATGWVPPEDTA